MSADRERCVPIVDDNGVVVASVRTSGEVSEEIRRVWLDLVAALADREAAEDAADPDRVARREAAQARNHARNVRLRGER